VLVFLLPSSDPHAVAENTTPQHIQRQRVNDKIFFNILELPPKKICTIFTFVRKLTQYIILLYIGYYLTILLYRKRLFVSRSFLFLTDIKKPCFMRIFVLFYVFFVILHKELICFFYHSVNSMCKFNKIL